MYRNLLRALGTLAVLSLTGCATSGDWQTETAGSDFRDGTIVLGELVLSASRQEVLANQGLMSGAHKKLIAAGYGDDQIVDDAVATVWTYCYGHNSGVPLCSHHGHFIAYVPEEFRGRLSFDEQGEGMAGDLVEISLTRNADGGLVGKVVAVFRKSGSWEPCRQARLGDRPVNDALMSLGGVGPARALWVECEGIQDEGWVRMPVPAAPPNDPRVSQWFRVSE